MSEASYGWRACIDHIIRPDSPCPVCEVEKLTDEIEQKSERIKQLEGEKNYVVRILTDLKDGMGHEIIERMLMRLAPLTTKGSDR